MPKKTKKVQEPRPAKKPASQALTDLRAANTIEKIKAALLDLLA